MTDQRRRRPPPPTREARTARRLLWLIPTTTIALALLTRLVVTSEFVSREVAFRVASDLAYRTQSAVQLSDVSFSLTFAPCFKDLEFYRSHGPVKVRLLVKEACVDRWASALGSGFHAIRIKLDTVAVEFEGSPRVKSGALVDVKPEDLAPEERSGRGALREIQLVFDDLRLRWDTMPFPERLSSGSFGPIDGSVTVQIRAGRSAATLSVREPISGAAINGRVTPTEEGWDLSAGLEGDLVPIFANLLEAAELDLRALRTEGQIGASYSSKKRLLTLDVDLEQSDIDLMNDIVSASRLAGFDARQRARIEVDFEAQRVEAQNALLEINGIPVVLSLVVYPGERSPAFQLGADLRTIALARLLRAIPGSQELEFTRDLSPDVQLALSFRVGGALRDPDTWEPKLEYRFQGIGREGAGTGLEYLRGPFEHRPLTQDGRTTEPRIVGPGTDMWVSFKDVPYLQRRAILVSEDSTFFFHQGVEMAEVKSAIKEAITTGQRSRGGSTLTQQLAKNLFLSRERTALRKLRELILTLTVEAALSKEEIFETYVNIIEWGPNVYGLKEAVHHYFDKPLGDLSPKEMVYLARIIPNPILYHRHFEQGFVPSSYNTRVHSTLQRLNRLGQLSDEDLAAAKSSKLRFARSRGQEEEEGSD